eukprot:TRINITY_DN14483_c0_g1_i2.p1 TRINITY_DN14483_c0_g1~~TRINITY_DN14483_c0_g1_i2.p1  ORF type:complete len:136 (+),score=55.15 TRINITY_DN14483_c0_g1_i2:255-662(+)
MTEMNDFITQNREYMNTWLERICSDEEEGREEDESKIVAREEVKENCLKWMYSEMWSHRQALKRDLRKKLGEREWQEMERDLERLKILNEDESSESNMNTGANSANTSRRMGSSIDDMFPSTEEKDEEEESSDEL